MPFVLNQRQVRLLLIGGTAMLTALSLLPGSASPCC
jgi:hypothetical protein